MPPQVAKKSVYDGLWKHVTSSKNVKADKGSRAGYLKRVRCVANERSPTFPDLSLQSFNNAGMPTDLSPAFHAVMTSDE
jgi:hypothetical protein